MPEYMEDCIEEFSLELVNEDEKGVDSVVEDIDTATLMEEEYELSLDENLFADQYEKQKAIELTMSSNHEKSRIMSWLMNDEQISDYVSRTFDEEMQAFTYELMFQLILRKRIDILTVVGVLRSKGEAHVVISKCVEVLKAGLCLYDPVREQFVVKINLPEEVQEEIDRFGYPLPMITKPRYLRNNRQTGYLTIRGSLLLKNNHHDEDINLDHLNRVNRIPLRVNTQAFDNTELVWEGMEKPKNIFKLHSYNQKKKNFDKFKKDARTLITMMVSLGNKFYLTHKTDKRGRIYCQGYHFSYQGSDWNKAFIEFDNQEIIELE